MKNPYDPFDPYEDMMRGTVVFLIVAFIMACVLALSGCVNAPVAPNLKLPEMKPQSCPKLDLPPLPKKVYLDIRDDKVMADAGGESVLRAYVACRAALK